MIEKLLAILKIKELRSKVLFVLLIFAVFRLSAAIPIPGIDALRLRAFFAGNELLGLLNLFTGSALQNFSIMMLGLGPYITASIIMQLLTMVFPKLRELYEEGEAERQKFNQYSRLLTVPLCYIQGYGLIALLKNQGIIGALSPVDLFSALTVVTAGTVFLMWLGELISEKGIGNGASLLIFAGIVADLPLNLRNAIATYDASKLPSYIAFVAVAIFVVAAVSFITESQRNIPVNYAKRVRGMKMYGGVSTHLPLRVNQAGVIPIIFALSILLFPSMVATFLSRASNSSLKALASFLQGAFSPQSLGYIIFYFLLVVLFTYFYTAVTFEPRKIAENLQRNGGFIPGIRPGEQTAGFINYVLNRIILLGAVFLGVIAVLPIIIQQSLNVTTLTIGGTAILIVVSVVLETIKQIESHILMREYEK